MFTHGFSLRTLLVSYMRTFCGTDIRFMVKFFKLKKPIHVRRTHQDHRVVIYTGT